MAAARLQHVTVAQVTMSGKAFFYCFTHWDLNWHSVIKVTLPSIMTCR